jgi:hypothetical protein
MRVVKAWFYGAKFWNHVRIVYLDKPQKNAAIAMVIDGADRVDAAERRPSSRYVR